MANRQALRELQDRLAQRLQVARTQGTVESWLAVECAGVRYLVPLSHAGEIFPFVASQPVPYTAPWFLGIANLRGGLFGVIDLAGFIQNTERSQPLELRKTEARMVAFNPSLEINSALVIDRLLGLRNRNAFVSVEPAGADAPDWLGHTMIDADQGVWLEVNMQRLSQSPRFLTVGI